MKTIFVSLCLLLISFKNAQTSSETCQSYQQIIGLYTSEPFSAYQSADSQRFYSQAPPNETVGKCNSIPCIGSPIFLVEQAQRYIDQQFDLTNKYSQVQYLCYHKNTSKSSSNSVIYRFIFEIATFQSSKYIGVEVDSSIAGLGNAQYNRFILHSDLQIVKNVLGVPGLICKPRLTCGDQKLFYSYYNRDGTSQLPHGHPGRNYNTSKAYLLNQIKKQNTPSKQIQCEKEHYLRIFNKKLNNFFRDETFAITPPIRENFYCNPRGLAIDRIRIACRNNGIFRPDNFEAFQLIRRDPTTDNIEPGPVQGNASVADRYFKDISLNGAAEVQFEFWGADKQRRDLRLFTDEIRIVTYDSRNKVIDEIRCGEYFDHNLIRLERVEAKDFLGFWYNFNGKRNIQRLGLIVYNWDAA